MSYFLELVPVVLFFIAFKIYGIYTATIVGIVLTAFVVLINRLFLKKWDKKQIITLIIFLVFGGMTLYFHNPIFVKWKPTVIFWIFAFIIITSQFFMKNPLLKTIMENAIQEKGMIPDSLWRTINWYWAAFFIIIGSVNLYIAYYFDNATWVNFKVFGVTAALLLFSVLQALYLLRHLETVKHGKRK